MEIDNYLTYDQPVPYKNLLIHPATMIDYIRFHECVICLLLDKNSVPDLEVISMSYLTYLISVGIAKPRLLAALDGLLRMTISIKTTNDKGETVIERLTDSDDIKVTEDNKTLILKGEKVTSSDFDEIKGIICQQNQIEMIDESISKEVRDLIKQAEDYKMRQNETKMCSLEDQLIAVVISTSLSLEDIYRLTIRKFSKILERVDHTMHYKIYLEGVMTGNLKMKDGSMPKHWLTDLTKDDKHKDTKFDYDEAKTKFA